MGKQNTFTRNGQLFGATDIDKSIAQISKIVIFYYCVEVDSYFILNNATFKKWSLSTLFFLRHRTFSEPSGCNMRPYLKKRSSSTFEEERGSFLFIKLCLLLDFYRLIADVGYSGHQLRPHRWTQMDTWPSLQVLFKGRSSPALSSIRVNPKSKTM